MKLTCLTGSRIAYTRTYSWNESPSWPTTTSRSSSVGLGSTRKQQIGRCSAWTWRCRYRSRWCCCYRSSISCSESAAPSGWCCTTLLRRPPGPHGDMTLHPGHQSLNRFFHFLSVSLSFSRDTVLMCLKEASDLVSLAIVAGVLLHGDLSRNVEVTKRFAFRRSCRVREKFTVVRWEDETGRKGTSHPSELSVTSPRRMLDGGSLFRCVSMYLRCGDSRTTRQREPRENRESICCTFTSITGYPP